MERWHRGRGGDLHADHICRRDWTAVVHRPVIGMMVVRVLLVLMMRMMVIIIMRRTLVPLVPSSTSTASWWCCTRNCLIGQQFTINSTR